MDIIIRGHALPGDFFDVDFIDRYEDCTKQYQNDLSVSRAKTYERTSDGYRALIRDTERFFDNLFGPGTSAQLFAGKQGDMREHMSAVNELANAFRTQSKEINDISNTTAQRQAANVARSGQMIQIAGGAANGGNRQQRRRKHH